MTDFGWLQEKFQEYLGTLDNKRRDESYCTDRELADSVVGEFIAWLRKKYFPDAP